MADKDARYWAGCFCAARSADGFFSGIARKRSVTREKEVNVPAVKGFTKPATMDKEWQPYRLYQARYKARRNIFLSISIEGNALSFLFGPALTRLRGCVASHGVLLWPLIPFREIIRLHHGTEVHI